MACNECNDCQEQETSCSCIQKDMSTDCILYTSDDLECTGIKSNTILTNVIQEMDEFICTKFNEVVGYFSLVSVGVGAAVYKGISGIGQKEIRSITKTGDLIIVAQNTDDIAISIDEEELTTFIEGIDTNSTYSVDNLSDGVEIYKDSTVVGDNTQFNLRTIKSNTLVITQDEDDITIETEELDLGGVRDFIVNTRYTGDEELGTVAKPYKTLDAAIIDYIGTGTRLSPEFGSSRILCTGGQSHNFTENLSINNLILEVEAGTTIKYVGTDLYPLDFRTLQTSSGGYGTQDRNLNITVKGFGTIVLKNLFSYVVNSGHTIVGTRRINQLYLENITIISLYKLEEFVGGITRSDLSPWISNTREALFYFGDVDEPCIIIEGQNGLVDNSGTTSSIMEGINITCISQQVILIDNAFSVIRESYFTHRYDDEVNSFVIADDTALVGTVLTENPLLSYALPNQKDDLCLVKIIGNGSAFINGGILSGSFDITLLEAWYLVLGDSATLDLSNGNNENIKGGALASNFIETRTFHPTINISNTNVDKTLKPTSTVINTSINPFTKATINNCNFTFALADNIDLTKTNTVSVTNVFNNRIVESLQIFSTKENAVIGGLASGNVFINRKIINAGSFVTGEEYKIETIGTTDFTLIGSLSNTVGQYFTATGTGTGTGTASINNRDIV